MDDVDLMLGNPTLADRKNKFQEQAAKTGRLVSEQCPNNNSGNLLNPYAGQWSKTSPGQSRSRSPSPRPGEAG